MDELDKRFRDFLADRNTSNMIKNCALREYRKLPDEIQIEYTVEDITQMAYDYFLSFSTEKKKEIWPKILDMPNRPKYLEIMIKNHLKDKMRVRNQKDPYRYFRKKLVDNMHKIHGFEVFKEPSDRRMYYARKGAVSAEVLDLMKDDINDAPFDDRFTRPDVTVIKTARRMEEIALCFYEFWSKMKGADMAVPIDGLCIWITNHVTLADVYVDKKEYEAPDTFIGELAHRREKNDPFDAIGRHAPLDTTNVSEMVSVLKRVIESLSLKEKKCFTLLFKKKLTLEDAAMELGYKGASGVSLIRENIRKHMIRAIGDAGYSLAGDRPAIEEAMIYLIDNFYEILA